MKKHKILTRFLMVATLLLIAFPSCKKDFFDINDNPNFPPDVDVRYLLPSAEAAIAHALGNDLAIYGGIWAQYWTQSPASSQYKSADRYNPSSNDFDHPWSNLYSDALEDLQKIIEKGTAGGRTQYVACAKILQAYAYQVLTDNWGDIPFSQALQAPSGNFSPHFDSQSSIYTGIIALVDEGLALADENLTGTIGTPGSDDLLLGGDMFLWKEFAYTLKLKIYLRMAYVNPALAQAGIAAMDSSATFLGAGEEVRINYGTEGGKTNPLTSSIIQLNFVQNLVASKTAVDYLITNNDPRLDVFYDPDPVTGAQVGIAQGDFNISASTPVSLPGTATGGHANNAANAAASSTAPVKLMTGYESFFLQAEAAARGWLTSAGSAQSLYEAGITENFASYGLPDTAASAYFTQPAIAFPAGPVEDQVKAIITQKWIAMCGNQNDEAWIEWRRTNYPDFFTISVESLIGNSFPERMLYPSGEVSNNGSFPGQKPITLKVWWDVN
jgi:hypothetical protein